MKENHLLAYKRKGNPYGPAAHDRSITTDTPDVMWGTDATSTLTLEGPATIFIAVDHHTQSVLAFMQHEKVTALKHSNPFDKAFDVPLVSSHRIVQKD